MKHTHSKLITFIIFFASLFIFSSCNNKNEISIVDTTFGGEIERTANFEFTFNQDLVEQDLINKADNGHYFHFDPPFEYSCRWLAKNKVKVIPKNYLLPVTDYTVRLDAKTIQYEFKKIANDKILKCHTPYLKFDKVNTFWKGTASNNGNKALIGGELLFSENILLGNLQPNLRVELDGKPVNVQLTGGDKTKKVLMEIRDVEFTNKPLNITIYVDKGLALHKNASLTKQILKQSHSLEPPKNLKIDGVKADHDGVEGSIYVNTSQQIKNEDVKSKIKIKPQVPFILDIHQSGFTLSSEKFDIDKTYQLQIDKSLTGVFNGNLEENYTEQIVFGQLAPAISFVDEKAIYLSPDGRKNIGVQIVNVQEVKVEIYKIFNNNIIPFMREGLRYGYYNIYDEDRDYWDYFNYRNYNTDNYGQLVAEENFVTEDLDRLGKIRLLHFDFRDKLPDFEGIYVMKVTGVENSHPRAHKLISFSDIGIIAKNSENQIHVFVNSINKAGPISGAKVNLISSNNQLLETITTNNNGVAVLSDLNKKLGDFKLAMLTVQKGEDFNYIMLNQSRVETARFEVSGKRVNKAGMDAFIYGDRDLYRPGETVHISTIVRETDWDVPSRIPVNIKVLFPNGKEFKNVRKTLDEDGSCEMDFVIPAAAVTGTYTTEVYGANDVLLSSKPFSVEEFMPDRIKVDLRSNLKDLQIGDEMILAGKATNFFGPPASNRNYEVQLNYKRKPFMPKGFPQYTFHVDNKNDFGSQVREGKTDKQGEFAEKYPIPNQYQDMGVLEGTLFTTVFDESGRPVNRVLDFDVYTQDVFYGIGPIDRYVSGESRMTIPLAAVDKNEKVVDTKAHLEILRYQWRTVLESTGRGAYRYKSQKEKITVVSEDINIEDGKESFSFVPKESGEYLIKISRPENSGNGAVSRSFYSYRFGRTQASSFEVNKEGRIDMTFDKDKYDVGETATVLMKAPFEGKMLITVERDEVLSYTIRDTDKKAVEYKIKLTEEHCPNVFISATLIRPMGELNVPLTIAHGYAPLIVENARHRLDIKVLAHQKSRSKTKQTITVETEPNAKVALAVVDEGILQIKNYQTPDPYNYFYQKRALDVNSYDIYPYLYPEMIGSNMLSGGGYGLAKRVNPVTNKRVKLVSFWSGIKTADGSGKINYDIDIPEFSGDLRVMAVAYKGKKFGSVDENMKVADPLVISTGLPRFFSPGDTIEVPVTLTNTTDKTDKAEASIVVDGPIKVLGKKSIDKQLKPNEEERVQFKVLAKDNIGAGSIVVNVNAMGEKFSNTTDITVRPPSSLQKISDSGMIDGGKKQTIDWAHTFIPETVDGELILSNTPLAGMSDDLKYLLGYPHGCIEQTTSKAFPQIYYQDLAMAVGQRSATNTMDNSMNPNYNVQEAINKIESFQMPDGALSYWPGGRYVNWWSSVFCRTFFIRSKRSRL